MSDQVSSLDAQDGETVALAVGAGGVLALIGGWILDSGLLRALGLIAAIAGGGLFAREKLAERRQKIDEAETDIRSELDKLDPVARAQVLEDIAQPDS
jgi:hypothetical protein